MAYNLNIKWRVYSFLGYVVISSLVFAVVVHFWLPAGLSHRLSAAHGRRLLG